MTESISSKIGNLRTICTEELELMLSWRNAPSVRMNMYTQHEISKEEHASWWERNQGRKDQKYFMYECKSNPFGVVAFNGIDDFSKNSAWAFYAAPDAPRGTGSRMEYLALEYAFKVLELHKLFCEVLEFNPAVIKLHEKFGFKIEGVFRKQYKVKDNFFDIYRMGIFASEWNEKRDAMLNKLLKIS